MYPRCAQLFLTILFLTTCFSVTAKSADVVKASNSKASEIVFVDAGIKNSEALLRGVNPQVDVVYIDSQRDGVEQIAQTLATRKNINAIHILSHGRSGMLDLGATKLTAASILGKHADEMNIIRGALSQNADILVYGCNFAQGARGAKAVELLAATIGADVLASDNLTGAAALGGDWDMEIRSGEIETAQISAEGWNDVLAPILINATSAPALSGGTGVGAKALWSNAGAVGATAIDLQAEVISGTGTNIVFSNSSTGTGNVKVRTLSTVETTIRWQAFETGTMNPVSGEPTFMMLDIDGAGGVPESVESVAASLTGLLSYTVDTATELVVTTVSGTVRASGTFDAPNAQSTTYEAAWVSYDWTGVSSWDMVYKSEVASAHDYVHDGNGEFIFTSPNVTLADSTPPVVAITSSLIANAANASTYSVSGGCTAGDGDVTVLITNATPASQPATCTGGGAWSASFDVTAITDANNAIIIDANQTDAATNTGNATQVLLDKDVAIATPTINALTTNNTTPTITGTAEAASAVAVTVAGATFTVAANGSGDWSVDTSVVPDLGTFSPDVNGSNEVSATSTDAAGNTALDVTANELIIDTTAPSIPTVNTLVTNDTTPVITGTWDDATAASLSVTVNSVTYVLGTDAQLSNVAANWTLDLSAVTLVAGAYGVVVSTADAAGNTSGDATANELIIIGVANPVNTTINVNLASVAADGSLSTITVQAKDINGIDLNASGGTVTLAATGSASISAVMDNNDGTYTATISNLVVEPVTISGTINGGGNAITDTAAVSFTIGAASGATTTITATPTSVLIGGASSTITVQAKDSNGNNFAGSAGTVVLSTTSGAVINSVIDNNNGTYTATVSNTVVEVATITGTIAGNAIIDSAAVTFTPDGNFTIDAINNVNLNENAAYTGVTPAITGAPIGAVTYSLSGVDAGDFTINASTGAVSMVARNFENPVDANTDNIYALTITATDTDTNTATQNWTVKVNNEIEVAVFSINAIADTSVGENSVYTEAAPVLTGTPIGVVTYSLGGADAGDFSINASTGVVSMVARNFEAPVDANTDNVYDVSISAVDADGNTATVNAAWNVTVNDVTETANFTINAISNANVNENLVYTSVTPAITGAPIGAVSYSLSGVDASDFTIDAATGIVSMVARNFESPADANTDNTYALTITVTDADENTATQSWTVQVNDISESASFTINAISNVAINENTAYTSVTPAIAGTPIGGVAYSLSGADAGDFAINTSTGVISMVARDFEFPADANTDNVYALTITATDTDANVATRSWTVAVNDVFEDADSDGLSDAIECPLGPPNCPDTDGDGIPDFQETDSDGDGISDAVEVGSDPNNPTDSDGDSIPDYVDNGDDFDGDGILDVIECPDYLSDCPDSDNDGQLDYVEIDSDSDNILDKVEAGVDPTQPVNTDGDLVSDAPDYQDADSDEDGVPDSVEGVVDTDGDSIPDYIDVASAGPDAGDSDGDGILDDIECELYRFCADSDADGTRDYMETDSDNDGIDDAIEVNTSGNDLDTDGIDDNFDIDSFTSGVDALDLNSDGIIDTHPLDSDGDGTPDYQDTDSDNDGISDNDVSEGLTDIDADGIPDYVDVDINNSAGTADNSGDSDSDGISDFVECPAYPTCPDSDGDGKPDYFDAKDQDGPLGNIDGDSELNYLDLNDDNDGIADSVEDLNTDGDDNPFTNPTDTDGDGTPDYQDADSDNDGIDDVIEGVIDSDGDGIPDYVDAAGAGSDAGDSDGDGASDLIECPSYPACPDSDSDGIPDYMDADSTPAVSAAETTISVSAASVAADGASSTITVQAKDANGNNLTISGGAVTLAATGSGIIAAVTDNGDGTYTATISNQVAEAVTISGTISGNAITDTAIVTFTAADVAVAPTSSGGGGGSSNNPAYMLLLLLILVTLRFKRRT